MAIKKKEEAKQPVVEVSKLQQFFDRNKKVIYGIGIAAIVIVVGIFLYINFVRNPRREAARKAVAVATADINTTGFAAADSLALENMLHGDPVTKSQGLVDIIDEYGKKAGAAEAYAGAAEMQLGHFAEAKAHLEKYKTDDPIMKAAATAAIADCDVELGNLDAAAAGFQKAADMIDNVTSARYLFKAGLVYEALGQNDKALEAYRKIKTRYPDSYEAQTGIDIYISKLETK